MTSDPFDPSRAVELPPDIAVALEWSRPERGPFGTPIFYVPDTGSTNDAASRLALAGAAEGTTVVAESQTSGRGRQGRIWASPAGAGLYVSTIVRPGPGDRDARAIPSALTLMAGVALAEGIREATGLCPDIKWPNDLMVGRRKLAGILAEASATGTALEYVVLGFGINLREAAYPPEVAARATSLESELGRAVDRGAVLARSLVHLARVRQALASGQIGPVLQRWRELAPAAEGAPVEWSVGGHARRGRTAGLDDDGALRVAIEDRIERVRAGEIIWL